MGDWLRVIGNPVLPQRPLKWDQGQEKSLGKPGAQWEDYRLTKDRQESHRANEGIKAILQ